MKAGAKFIVSPGFDPEIVDYCLEKEIPVLPGCISPSEVAQAVKRGLKTVKFFPAEQAGGCLLYTSIREDWWMRYFRDGVLKMIIKKVLPGDGSTFLYHNSGSFHGKENPFSVVDQMKIHGILCAERVVGCDGICNLTMGFDCLLMQCISLSLIHI